MDGVALEALMSQPPSGPELPDALSLLKRPYWHAKAACRGLGTDRFFPDKADALDAAKDVCATCPVAGECLDYAMAHPDTHGVWGGRSVRERERMRREVA